MSSRTADGFTKKVLASITTNREGLNKRLHLLDIGVHHEVVQPPVHVGSQHFPGLIVESSLKKLGLKAE